MDAFRVIQKLRPQPGDVLVFQLPPGKEADASVAELLNFIVKEYPECTTIALEDGWELKRLDKDAMREAGWIPAKGDEG